MGGKSQVGLGVNIHISSSRSLASKRQRQSPRHVTVRAAHHRAASLRRAQRANSKLTGLDTGWSAINDGVDVELEMEGVDTADVVIQDDANDGTICLDRLHGGLARRADRHALRFWRFLSARVGDLPDVRCSVQRNVPDHAGDVPAHLESGVRMRRE